MIIRFVNVETDPRLRYHTTHLPQQKWKTTIFQGCQSDNHFLMNVHFPSFLDESHLR